jgi:hypothetical protein
MDSGVMAMTGASQPNRGDGVVPVNSLNALMAVTQVGVVERRRESRRTGVDEHGVQGARVRPGIDVRLLDVSAEGALIETAYQLFPGRRLVLQLSFATCVVAIGSSVLRCVVSHASADRIAYRGGLVFDRRLRWIVDTTGVVSALVD